MNKKWVLTICCMAISSQIAHLNARVYHVRNQETFYRLLKKRTLALCVFYENDRGCGHSNRRCCITKTAHLLGLLEHMSRFRRYDDGDLIFIKVCTDICTLSKLANEYEIEETPTFILFKFGVPVRDGERNICMLTGHASLSDIEEFIEKHLKQTITQNMKNRAEERRREREDSRLRYMYYSPYLYWGYPYWDYPYWYGRFPRAGFGFPLGL